jgi:dihydrofolate reductase
VCRDEQRAMAFNRPASVPEDRPRSRQPDPARSHRSQTSSVLVTRPAERPRLAYNLLHNAIRTARMCRVMKGSGMAKLVFGMNQSLDGYVDHMAFAPSPTLFRHFIEEAQGQAGSIYGRQMYEVMRYWDNDNPEWDAEEHAFAAAWRNQPKWVVSRSLKSVGPNARLIKDNLESVIRELKAERDGEIEVAGPDLAQSLTELGLIDEYRIYLHPVVLGHGKPYFAGPQPPLRLMTNDRIGEDVIRLTYVPA